MYLVIGVGSPVGARRGRGAIAGRPPTPGPHRSIDIAGGGTPETSQNGRGATDECNRGSSMADRPRDDGPGNHCAPPSDATGQSVDVVGGWAHKTAGSGWVSFAVAHLSKCRHGAGRDRRQQDPDAGYGRPQAHRWMWPDDRLTSQWSFLFPIEAD